MPRWFYVVTSLALVACVGDADPPGADASRPESAFVWPDVAPTVPPQALDAGRGLTLLSQVEQPTTGPHLVELAPHGDVVYVANSNDVFAAYLLEPDGGLLTTLVRPPTEEFLRCTTLAVHASSRTLYCSSDGSNAIVSFDLSDPREPTLRDMAAVSYPGLFARDIHVVGDQMYIARFEHGLWSSTIMPDGSLSAPVPTQVRGDVRFVDGEDPVVAVGARGLLVLRGRGAELDVQAEVVLGAPPQHVRVVGSRALVALGSEGVVVIDISSEPPRVVTTVVPPAVTTSADLSGDALAVTTLTGAYLYDLRGTPPRLAGFAPAGEHGDRAGGVMLHGRFVGGELIVSDWSFVERYAIEIDGSVVDVDHPRGIYVAPGEDVRIPFDNIGEQSMEVVLQVPDGTIRAQVPAGETVRLTVQAASIASSPAGDFELIATTTVGDISSQSSIRLVVRGEVESGGAGRPAPGDAFPSVAMADRANEVFRLPMSVSRQRLVFFTTDCAAMWPVIEDAAHLWRRGELDEGAELHLIGRADIGLVQWDVRWGLTDVRYGHHDVYAPPEVLEENGPGALYEERFRLDALPGAASYPTDYVVSAEGRVELVERYYRGRHTLR